MRTVGALFFIQKKRELSFAHFFVLPRKSLFAIVPFCRCKILLRFAQYFARLFCVFFGDLTPCNVFTSHALCAPTLLPNWTLRLFLQASLPASLLHGGNARFSLLRVLLHTSSPSTGASKKRNLSF